MVKCVACLELIVVHELDNSVLADHIRLAAFQQAKQVLWHAISFPHLPSKLLFSSRIFGLTQCHVLSVMSSKLEHTAQHTEPVCVSTIHQL